MFRLSFFIIVATLGSMPALAAELTPIATLDHAAVAQVDRVGKSARVRTLDGRHWRLVKSKLYRTPAPSTAKPTDGLPDGVIAYGKGRIREAWLIRPTDRYDHAVLGDAIEAAGLAVRTDKGRRLELILDDPAVFEDRYPRFADLDGDGEEELYLVRADEDDGASLVVADVVDGALQIVARSPAIGLGHRWLNPVGAGDMDGDGRTEVAVVITPHIGGTVRVYERRGDALVEEYWAHGFSNHAIGWAELGWSAVLDWDGDGRMDLVVPDDSRRTLKVLTVRDGDLDEMLSLDLPARLMSAFVVADGDGDGKKDVVFATVDGKLWMVGRGR